MKRTTAEPERETLPVARSKERKREPRPNSRDDPIVSLQRTVGNQAVREASEMGGTRPRRTVSQPGDEHEREADRIADQVVEMGVPGRDGSPAGSVRSRSTGDGLSTQIGGDEFDRGLESLRGGGSPLSASLRSYFEPRFDRDLGSIRLHTGSRADALARRLNARAFTLGEDIAFRSGAFRPETSDGRRLLAHELAHAQQSRAQGGGAAMIRRKPLVGYDPAAPLQMALQSLRPSVSLTLSPDDTRPSPDHSRTMTALGAWEVADFRTKPQINVTIETTDSKGQTASFVTSVDFDLGTTYEYYIARSLWTQRERGAPEPGKNAAPGARKLARLPPSDVRQIYNKVRRHADQHFVRYNRVIAENRARIERDLSELPGPADPEPVSAQTLRTYVTELLKYHRARIEREAWEATCDWEKEDYPRLEKEINRMANVSGMKLTPDCGTPPTTVVRPTLSTGSGGSSDGQSGSPERSTGESDESGSSDR